MSSTLKITLSTLIILVVIVGVYLMSMISPDVPITQPVGEETPDALGMSPDRPMKVVVENTPSQGGVLAVPAGFPSEVPLESGAIIDSVSTRYPEQNAKQLSLSFYSAKSIAQKYAEYKTYLQQAGYQITEGAASSPVKAIFGKKGDVTLSVAISNTGEKTLVQIAYFMFES